ncbi:arginine repressor [[Clostridium] colinum]|uniref:arginine repressor n=1 Tax=[Clostridium] colinum TaxID=36835 RepID=UPI0020253301|nr:arginine repressor [[Clostridium] colinum]
MKTKRHSKIKELITEYDIETQDDLTKKLREAGFDVTQATVSRDIRELKLTKVTNSEGKQKYQVFLQEDKKISEKFIRVFKDGVVSIDYAQNIIVIKTLNGMAMGVATALDSMGNDEIIGSIAGDDNIFCVVKNEEKAIKLVERLRAKINS